jgi:F-type H+-transporting ATPase subunit gamma
MVEVLNSLASRAEPTLHPLLWQRGEERQLLVVIGADKGLCGGFNANILRMGVRFLEEQERIGRRPGVELVGRKARDFFRRRQWPVRAEHVGVFQPLSYKFAQDLSRTLMQAFVGNEVDQIFLLYNEFKSVIQQRVVVEMLLPIPRLAFDPRAPALDYVYEPEPAEIIGQMLPKHVEVQVWRALLESQAAEHGARMTAMDAATNNAGEMIDRLTLHMNKVRQAAITKEIIEVVSGAGSPS